jgi:Flp pilus assembly protein TadG
MTRRLHNNSRRGSSLLEATLVYTAFLMLLIGTIDLGHILFLHQSINERVRDAVRYGTSRPISNDTDTAVKNIVLYNTATPAEDATASFGLTPQNVNVSRTVGVGENPSQLTVSVTALAFRFLTPFAHGTRTAREIKVTLPLETE